ncbi:MAG: hypothetical protein WCP06_14445 [Verrucomicrobiota bacterium]
MKKSFSLRRGPDIMTEELVAALSCKTAFEFKALFTVIYGNLRARNAASGGEEMLRLRAYEKLQQLVRGGQVEKTGKQYKGVASALLDFTAKVKALRDEMAGVTAAV